MTDTIQEQKKKLKKSYTQLLEECSSFNNKIAALYIPKLCEALRDENPNWTNEDIKSKVFNDCREIGWGGKTGSTIYHNYPSWLVEDDPDHKRVKKNWETRNANLLKSSADRLSALSEQIPEPPKPKEEDDEEWDTNLPSKFREIGEKGTTILGQLGIINGGAAELFKGLTDIDHLPHDNEDLINDYVKPTKDFRKNLVLELDRDDRIRLWNRLGAVEAVVQDMLDILEKEREK